MTPERDRCPFFESMSPPAPGVAYDVRLGASLLEEFAPDDARRALAARATVRDGGDDEEDEDARRLTVFRYDWRAENADEGKRARVRIDPRGVVEVVFEAKDDDGDGEGRKRTVRYRGMRRAESKRARRVEEGEVDDRGEGASEDLGVDCALIFDERSGTFTLERVDGVIGSLRIARDDSAAVGAGELGDARAERAHAEKEEDAGLEENVETQLPSSTKKQ